MISVTVIGCGDAFINRYWPTLELLANQGLIKLTVVDKGPLPSLIQSKLDLADRSGEASSVNDLTRHYQNLQQMLQDKPDTIAYFNVENPEERALYLRLTQDIVFVLVPDNIHIKYAREWLKRAVLVLVEKPYNRNVVEAQTFEQTLSEMVQANGQDLPYTIVLCIDHYLAKIFNYIMRRDEESLQAQIGVIKEIEFSICEAGGVEPWRAHALEAGMIYDMFCYLLAQISPFVRLETFLSTFDDHARIQIANHEDCPIRTESYANILHTRLLDLSGRSLRLHGQLGKGIGKVDNKFLRITGEHGTVFADFGPSSTGQLGLQTDNHHAPLFQIGKGHPEMLDAIFSGRFMEEPVGGLRGEDAVRILQILGHIRGGVDNRASCL